MTEACTLVIFGATGNLARRKLFPALYHLETAGLLHPGIRIICSGRGTHDDESWKAEVMDILADQRRTPCDDEISRRFCARMQYLEGDLRRKSTFHALEAVLADDALPRDHVFYIALPPSTYAEAIGYLGNHGLLHERAGWRRVVIEKPFGHDRDSAAMLQGRIGQYLAEHQIYRIDHYMGKAMVQNILVTRFANLMFEPIWNRNYIDHVQIVRTEQLGVGSRAPFYDQAGAMRDMIQSHLMQLMALVAMEPPVSMEAEDLRDEKMKVLKSVLPIDAAKAGQHAFRARYAAGELDGRTIPGYLAEKGVDAERNTETYAALRLEIDNWRWRGVPFYLRTGKRMADAQTLIAICFRHPPKHFFANSLLDTPSPNWLIMSVSPEESLRLEMTVKEPGLDMKTRPLSLDAPFRCEHHAKTDAYEGLLLDVFEGDRSLFLRFDEVEQAWRIIDPVMQAWADDPAPITEYPACLAPPDDRQLFHRPDAGWRTGLEPTA